MKRKLLFAFLVVLFGCQAKAQGDWTLQETMGTSPIEKIQFVNANKGWAVSGAGIFYTLDGGSTWSSQSAQGGYGLCMVNETTGYVCGSSGKIRKTTDGGTNWIDQNSGTTSSFKKIHFVDVNNGWAVTFDGGIYHTSDGGATWTQQNPGVTTFLWDVFATDANKCWVVGNSGTILHTSDGGTAWVSQANPLSAGEAADGLYFINGTTGWVVSKSGSILKTVNGGTTWVSQNSTTTKMLFSVLFLDASQGWISGQFGTILKTTDGGSSWHQLNFGNDNYYGLYFISQNQGWIGDSYGKIFVTYTGGGTVGINESNDNNMLTVFSPGKGAIQVTYTGTNSGEKTEIAICDLTGRQVYNELYCCGIIDEKILLNTIPEGLYIIKVTVGKQTITKKITI